MKHLIFALPLLLTASPGNAQHAFTYKDSRFKYVNFDGIDYIRLVQFIPAAPNIPYYFWIYDTTSNGFVRNKELEKITSPEFDSRQKRIFSFWRTSCCDHGQSTYKYINGRPTLIEESEVAVDPNDDNQHITTVKKLKNGRWKVTKTIEKGAVN